MFLFGVYFYLLFLEFDIGIMLIENKEEKCKKKPGKNCFAVSMEWVN